MDSRTPCIVGVAQKTYREADGDAPEPLQIWAEVARAAVGDSGGRGVHEAIDSLQVVYSMAWQYDDPPARLAALLGLKPGDRHYSGVSGTPPQRIVDDCAREILAGRREMALVVSAESLATRRRLRKRGHKPDWQFRQTDKKNRIQLGLHQTEIAHQIFQAYLRLDNRKIYLTQTNFGILRWLAEIGGLA